MTQPRQLRVPRTGVSVDSTGCDVDDLAFCGAVEVRAGADEPWAPLVERAIALGQRYEARRAQLNGSADRPAIAAALTEKELALARLVAQRRTNKEIAETLHLSEGTVKQYINQLYAKLDIGGAVRNKRAQLAALFGTKY